MLFKRLSDFGRFLLRHRRIGATPSGKPALIQP